MKKLIKFFIDKLPRRIGAALTILLGRKQSWLLITVEDRKNLENIILHKDFDIDITYEGLHPYLMKVMFKTIGDNIDDTDLLLARTMFEAEADVYLGKDSEYFNEDLN